MLEDISSNIDDISKFNVNATELKYIDSNYEESGYNITFR